MLIGGFCNLVVIHFLENMRNTWVIQVLANWYSVLYVLYSNPFVGTLETMASQATNKKIDLRNIVCCSPATIFLKMFQSEDFLQLQK